MTPLRTGDRITSGTSSSSNVVDLFGRQSRGPGTTLSAEPIEEVLRKSLNNKVVINDLLNAVEAAVANALAKSALASQFIEPSAFDAIYLSALAPDNFSIDVPHEVQALGHIRDLSGEIAFIDHWED